MKVLVERDVSPGSSGRFGQTPLSLAAGNGRERIVKLLLGREDVYSDPSDMVYEPTPLARAAEDGHEGIMKRLLERGDVNPNTPDADYGRAPLSLSAENGYEGIAKLLLERDVNPDGSCKSCLKPLVLAAWKSHERIVKLVVLRGDFNLHSSSKSD